MSTNMKQKFIASLGVQVMFHQKAANNRGLGDRERAYHRQEVFRLGRMIRSTVSEIRRHNPGFQR